CARGYNWKLDVW
nr:immunoglobulin heavy chain junction region [Macaca mulatta]